MPRLPETPPHIVAVCCADLHLWQTPPTARSVEKDWLKTQRGYLTQVERIASGDTLNLDRGPPLPIIIAGDIFDRYNPSYELVNFVINNLPLSCYAIPGQHDIINHRYDDLKKTAYWTLIKSDAIIDLHPDSPVEVTGGGGTLLRLHGFPWGFPIEPLKDPHDLFMEIAVVHKYVWRSGYSYPNAPKEQRVDSLLKLLKGYDVAIFGVNHKGFQWGLNDRTKCFVWNNGGFMRRKRDEIDYRPRVGLVMSDNTVKRHYLDVSKDKFTEVDENVAASVADVDASDFIAELQELGDTAINFGQRMRRFLDKHCDDPKVRDIVEQAMQKRRKK